MNAQPETDTLDDSVESSFSDALKKEVDGDPGSLQPFVDGDIGGLFFPGANRQEALDKLIHLLRYGPALLVVYGDQGVGKHFLADHLVSQLDLELFDIAMVQADVLMSASSLLGGLAMSWHCPQALALDNYQQKIMESASIADDESKVLLLIVRHAQFLDEESVAVLANILAFSAGLPVKVLLLLDAAELVEIEQLQVLIAQVADHFTLKLEPFTEQDTEQYLAYRLRTAGMGQVRFNEKQIAQIFNHSLGNVQRINEVAQALLVASLPKPKRKTGAGQRQWPWLHIGALMVVSAILLALLMSRNSVSPSLPISQSIAIEPHEPLLEPVNLPDIPHPDQSKSAQVMQASTQGSRGQSDVMKAQEPQAESPAKARVEQAVVEKPQPASLQSDPPIQASLPEPKAEAPAVAKSAPKAVAAPKPKPVDERAVWLRSLPADHYGLQLLGAKEKATVDKFLAMYPSVQNLTYYKTQRNGAPWFVVVQVSYPSYDAAKVAVSKLPSKLQKQGPWIRKIELIQKDLKN
jgi:DamX protein